MRENGCRRCVFADWLVTVAVACFVSPLFVIVLPFLLIYFSRNGGALLMRYTTVGENYFRGKVRTETFLSLKTVFVFQQSVSLILYRFKYAKP